MSLSIAYHGHACVSLVGPDGTVVIDPFFDDNRVCTVAASEVQCDAIGVTHGHHDHLGDAISIAKRTGAVVFTTAELAKFLQEHGITTHAMHVGGSHRFRFGEVKLVAAFHGGSIAEDTGHTVCTPCGIIVRMGGFSVYHAGDTALTIEMELLGRYDHIDLALLPIGDNYTMGPEDALHAVELIRPEAVIPIHYNTFPVIEQDAEQFKRAVETQTPARCVILQPGETHTLE